MSVHELSELFEQYPAVIAEMPSPFKSHQFILSLAQQNQRAYVEALYAYRESGTPFLIVHGRLSRQLSSFPQLVEPLERVQSLS